MRQPSLPSPPGPLPPALWSTVEEAMSAWFPPCEPLWTGMSFVEHRPNRPAANTGFANRQNFLLLGGP